MDSLRKILFLVSFVASSTALSAPTILYFGVDKPIVYDWMKDDVILNFSLVAADSSGQDSLAGAVLSDPVKNVPYGILNSSSQNGAFQLSLSQKQITDVRGHDPAARPERIFVVTVFNSKGESTSSQISISFLRGVDMKQVDPSSFDLLSHAANLPLGPVERVVNRKSLHGILYRINSALTVGTIHSPGEVPPLADSCESSLSHYYYLGRGPFNYTDIPTCQRALVTLNEFCKAFGGTLVANDKSLLKTTGSSDIARTIQCSKGELFYYYSLSPNAKLETYVGLVE